MKNENKKITVNNRKSVFVELDGFCTFAKDHDFIEITEWANGEGFDVLVSRDGGKVISLTWGEYDALKKLVKKLQKI